MKLDYEMIINADHVESVKFYPYENPKDVVFIAACEIYFCDSTMPKTFFHNDAQRVYNYYENVNYGHFWAKQINWS